MPVNERTDERAAQYSNLYSCLFWPAVEWIDRTPTAFQLIASNDAVCSGDSAWTVLCEDLNAPAINQTNLATINDERGGSTIKIYGHALWSKIEKNTDKIAI